MPRDWKNIRGYFYPDGSLRDIYVLGTSINDWEALIDFLNENYKITYTNGYSVEPAIDKYYALRQLKGNLPNNIYKMARIWLDEHLELSIHFFITEVIEFDVDPKEVKSLDDFIKIEEFMINVSKLLKTEVLMTGEDEADSPFFRVNYHQNLNQFYSKE